MIKLDLCGCNIHSDLILFDKDGKEIERYDIITEAEAEQVLKRWESQGEDTAQVRQAMKEQDFDKREFIEPKEREMLSRAFAKERLNHQMIEERRLNKG